MTILAWLFFTAFGATLVSCSGNISNLDDPLANPLIPINSWLTQLGETTKAFSEADHAEDDYCSGTAVDKWGNVYCAGSTYGSLGEANGGGSDAFVMKLNSDGEIQWVKQLGGATQAASGLVNDTSANDICYGVAVDKMGNVFCAGSTYGSLGEAHGGGSGDAFVMKLNSEGEIQWVKQLGGATASASGLVNDTSANDFCHGVAVDEVGNVYCAGLTAGDLAEANGGAGTNDAFVMKLNSDGEIQWIKQIGSVTEAASEHVDDTSGHDYCQGIAVDKMGNVYCAGRTAGDLAETHGGGNNDAFVMKLNSDGEIQWIKQLGSVTEAASEHVNDTSGHDFCHAVAFDKVDNVYCAGSTYGSLAEANGGGLDALVMKLDSDGEIQWIRQLGGVSESTSEYVNDTSGNDAFSGIAVDEDGNIYCAGDTAGIGEASGGSWDWDPLLVNFNSSGEIRWLRHLGAETVIGPDYVGGGCFSVAVDSRGNSYCAGQTYGGINEVNSGSADDTGDVFVMKLKPDGSLDLIDD